MKKLIQGSTEFLSFLIIFIFTLPASFPLLHKGFFLSDDGEWMIVRLTAFFEAFRQGQFPVRYLLRLNQGYGYPLPDFAYPAFLYIGSVVHVFHIGFIDSVKIIIFLSLFLGSVFSYIFLRKRFDKISSLTGSFVYLYAPYHLFDLYRRGSVGELLSISIIPFVFLQIENKNKALTAIGIFLLILSHNIIALISVPALFLYQLFIYRKEVKKKIIDVFTPFILGAGLSAFFFIPSVYDLRYIVFQKTDIADWSHFFGNLQIVGASSVSILIIGSILYIKNKKDKQLLFFLLLGLIFLFMGTFVSTPVWKVIPSSFILFPFRFLSLLPISLAFISALAVYFFKTKLKIAIALVIAVVSLYSCTAYLNPTQYFPDRNDSFYATNQATTTASNEYMPRWVKERPLEMAKSKLEIQKGSPSLQNVSYKSERISFTTKSSDSSEVLVNTIYFPGWNATIDGTNSKINYDNKYGVMTVNIPAGIHNIVFKFSETTPRLFADLISVISFVVLVLIIALERKYGFRKN